MVIHETVVLYKHNYFTITFVVIDGDDIQAQSPMDGALLPGGELDGSTSRESADETG